MGCYLIIIFCAFDYGSYIRLIYTFLSYFEMSYFEMLWILLLLNGVFGQGMTFNFCGMLSRFFINLSVVWDVNDFYSLAWNVDDIFY